ncbi:MAG TPA: hypothetical protein VGF30_15620 [Bacteroidia bacterium]
MKISPDFVPHEEFHTGTWLQSCKRPSWYYFRKGKSNNGIQNPAFAKSLDEPLRKLVLFLHKAGIQTTPSCSGHNKEEYVFMKIYEELKKDEEQIRTSGLQFKDVESGKLYLYTENNYRLPWTKGEFLCKVKTYQWKGVLGLKLEGLTELYRNLIKLEIGGVKFIQKNGVLLILTNNKSEDETIQTWKNVTGKIIEIVSTTI